MWFPTRDELVGTKAFDLWQIVEAKAIVENCYKITKAIYDKLSFSSCPMPICYDFHSDEYYISRVWFNQYEEDDIVLEVATIRSMLILHHFKSINSPIPIDIYADVIIDILRGLGYNISKEAGKYYCEV